MGKGSMHEERRDDLAAYALGALDADEAAALEEHLRGCDACAEYLTWLAPAVELLPASVEQLEPPERLRENLMAAVRAEAGAESQPEAPVTPRRRRWNIGGPVMRPATGFAAVAVLAMGAALGYVLSNSGGDDRDTVQAKAVGTVPADALVASVEHGAGGDAILHVERAPALAAGDVYQAWVSRGGTVEPAASFRPHEDGTAEAALGDTLEGADAVLVTEEPTPNEQQPTSAPILRADLG
jgi:anti-sigma-K factor RskA